MLNHKLPLEHGKVATQVHGNLLTQRISYRLSMVKLQPKKLRGETAILMQLPLEHGKVATHAAVCETHATELGYRLSMVKLQLDIEGNRISVAPKLPLEHGKVATRLSGARWRSQAVLPLEHGKVATNLR